MSAELAFDHLVVLLLLLCCVWCVCRDLVPAVTMLHMFLSSPKPTLRYVAVKTLSQIAALHPSVVSKCNEDLETLVSDSNRTIATLAISTLLKTGNESGVERLMKQITSFMGEITDEFKIVVVKAIHELCVRYPAKYRSLLLFLSNRSVTVCLCDSTVCCCCV